MNGCVTPRAIAYAAIQVCSLVSLSALFLTHFYLKLHFALNDATAWMSHYNGFNYEEYYEFIVDFFEEDQTPDGKAATNELLKWWNKYVFVPGSVLSITNATSDVFFHSLLPPEPSPLDLSGDHHSRFCNGSAKHAAPIHSVASLYPFL